MNNELMLYVLRKHEKNLRRIISNAEKKVGSYKKKLDQLLVNIKELDKQLDMKLDDKGEKHEK